MSRMPWPEDYFGAHPTSASPLSGKSAVAQVMAERSYSTKDASRILKLSFRQLQWWDERGVVAVPQESHRRLYSRDDLLWLAVVAALRNKGISFQKVRKLVGPKHRRRFEEKRDETDGVYLLTDEHEVYFESEQGAIRLLKAKRYAMFLVDLSELVRRIDKAIDRVAVLR